jgi:proteasome lid subunit RPN8/RPN11
MNDSSLRLVKAETRCMEVRSGDVPEDLARRADRYLQRPRSRSLRLFTVDRAEPIPENDHLAMHDLLILRGRYGRCVEPLREAIEGRGLPKVKEVALARAGQAAMVHGLGLDLGPIVAALSLNSRPVRGSRAKREHPLPMMEKEILRALLLEDRSEWVESERMARDLVGAIGRSYDLALDLAEELEACVPGAGSYHRIRIDLMMVTSRVLRADDPPKRAEDLERIAASAGNGAFPLIEVLALQELGRTYESMDLAREGLQRAIGIATRIDNGTERARSKVLLGSRNCAEKEGTPAGKRALRDNALEMVREANLLKEDAISAYVDGMAEAALWLARIGDSANSLRALRKMRSDLSENRDEEMISTVRAIAVLAYFKSGARKKGKKALLELLNTRPVKNHPWAYSILREAVSDQEWLRTDPDTAELFQDEIVYRIDREAVEEIIRRAKEAFPNEFGAMLRGIEHITHIEPVMEGAGGRTSFMFSLFSRFSQRNVPGEGVVHSHPSGSARPSGADLSMFSRFPGINLIVGYPFTWDSIAAYDRLGNRVVLEISEDE